MTDLTHLTRRTLLAGAGAVALTAPVLAATGASRIGTGIRVVPVDARHVRLKPSIFADAFAANRRYLLDLEPERLLHNFYRSAGLPAPRPGYGGWEAQGIAGHSLGHWLSACALTIAASDDRQLAERLDHALAEMAQIQAAHGDGYLGGTTVTRDDKTIDGKIVFEELRRGDIRSNGFDLNGGWVPLYTWHKVHAGLIDAHKLAGNRRAMPILLRLAGYLADVLEPLDEAQIQRILSAEHGGLNETYAETYALTGDPRWLRMAERIRHKAVLDPLAAEQDRLAGLHANTQIPKVIGLARLYELTGEARQATAARFFHDRVTHRHSYVIGGNSDREHFGPPNQLSKRITEATCEACNSYNMMKLTRHLYGWEGDARWFDYYERVQLNHIMAHQRPDTGRFVYFMPLASGARRTFSSPEDSFWCCVGSGMESHAKHADSIFWHDPSTLYVNLFIPAALDMGDDALALDLDTAMPDRGDVTLRVRRAPRRASGIGVRLPGWAADPVLTLNGAIVPIVRERGYAIVRRRWQAGDTLQLTLPMALTAEPTPDDPSTVAFVHGPLVLAADLGAASAPYGAADPALLTATTATAALSSAGRAHGFTARSALGDPLELKPFFAQYDRRTAVYFPTFTPARWQTAKPGYLAAAAEQRMLAQRTVDLLYLGEMQPERDHGFIAARSEAVNWNGRTARKIRSGDTMQMTLARRPGPAVLRLTVAGKDDGLAIAVTVDGTPIATPSRSLSPDERWGMIDYALPATGEQGRRSATIRVSADGGEAVVYEARMMTAVDAAIAPTV